MPETSPVAGSLLISSETLIDPHFARCVLLVLDADDGGTLGVILNRPSTTEVAEVLEAWQDMTTPPSVLFRGGPVGADSALAIGSLLTGPAVTGWQSLIGTLGMVDLDADPDQFVGRLTALRVYAGYTGWSAGQLEDEINAGSWHVAPSVPADLFSTAPHRLWAEVLRRQPPPLSMLATLPADATQN